MNAEKIINPPSGYLAFILFIVLLVTAGFLIGNEHEIIGATTGILDFCLVLPGLAVVNPNESKVLTLFGQYKGTVKEAPGFFEGLLAWLAMKLFGKAGVENIVFTRRLIIWTVIIISVYVIIRLLLRTELAGLTRQKAKSTAFSFTDLTEDLDQVNFDQRIAEALKENDYRLAICWQYLKTLFLLDKKQLISFAPHKTNIDYRYELKDKGLQEGFTGLSRIYEYAWYGRFVITETNYTLNAEKFAALQKQADV